MSLHPSLKSMDLSNLGMKINQNGPQVIGQVYLVIKKAGLINQTLWKMSSLETFTLPTKGTRETKQNLERRLKCCIRLNFSDPPQRRKIQWSTWSDIFLKVEPWVFFCFYYCCFKQFLFLSKWNMNLVQKTCLNTASPLHKPVPTS